MNVSCKEVWFDFRSLCESKADILCLRVSTVLFHTLQCKSCSGKMTVKQRVWFLDQLFQHGEMILALQGISHQDFSCPDRVQQVSCSASPPVCRGKSTEFIRGILGLGQWYPINYCPGAIPHAKYCTSCNEKLVGFHAQALSAKKKGDQKSSNPDFLEAWHRNAIEGAREAAEEFARGGNKS